MTRTEAERFAVALQDVSIGTPDGKLVVHLKTVLQILRVAVPDFDFVLTEKPEGGKVVSSLGFPRDAPPATPTGKVD